MRLIEPLAFRVLESRVDLPAASSVDSGRGFGKGDDGGYGCRSTAPHVDRRIGNGDSEGLGDAAYVLHDDFPILHKNMLARRQCVCVGDLVGSYLYSTVLEWKTEAVHCR